MFIELAASEDTIPRSWPEHASPIAMSLLRACKQGFHERILDTVEPDIRGFLRMDDERLNALTTHILADGR